MEPNNKEDDIPFFAQLKHGLNFCGKNDFIQLSNVECFPHVGTVETEKLRNTHPTIEVQVFVAHCYMTQR
jgi:hypothetical protein